MNSDFRLLNSESSVLCLGFPSLYYSPENGSKQKADETTGLLCAQSLLSTSIRDHSLVLSTLQYLTMVEVFLSLINFVAQIVSDLVSGNPF